MKLFYIPSPIETNFTLGREESLHCTKVLRLKRKDTVYITDGNGKLVTAQIINPDRRGCGVEVIEVKSIPRERDYRLQIAIAPTKNIERFEWFLEKATEIGIDSVVPVLCKNSERRVIKDERLKKVVISAMKQSLKAWLSQIDPLTRFEQFVTGETKGNRFIASGKEPAKNHLGKLSVKSNDVSILIGPEGDFTLDEMEIAIQNNFLPVSLGESRLRTETAGVVACHTINLINSLT